MVWEMAYSHSIHKADSIAWPASALTNSVAYFSHLKERSGRESKEKSPASLLPGPCQGNVYTPHPSIKVCTPIWRTEEGVLMTGMELLLLPCCALCWLAGDRCHRWGKCPNEEVFGPKKTQNLLTDKRRTTHLFCMSIDLKAVCKVTISQQAKPLPVVL